MFTSRRFRTLLVLILALVVKPSFSAEKPDEYYDPDVQRLITGRMFAFGGVGFGARNATAEEVLFGRLVAKRNSIRFALAAFEHGNDYSRCYALVALRELSPALYQSALDWIRKNGPKTITTGRGCIVDDEPLADVLKRIDSGQYQEFFRRYEARASR